MAKTVHTCTGCVPIDASILKVYAAMVAAISESHGLVIDDALSGVSKNPVENRVITNALTSKYTKPANGIPASDIASGVIPDVSGFVTKSVNDLVNYYLKSETYTKTEVQEMIGAIQGFSYEVVASLPTASASTKGKIYLVPSGDPQTQNVKDEFITIDNGASASPRYTWEQIGSTSVNLEGYVTTAQLNTALADYTTTANLTSLLAAKQDVIQDLSTIRSGAAAGATAYQKPGTGIPASDIASGVIPTVPTISTDVSADAASDAKTSSPKSVKTYVDAGIAAVESDLSDLADEVEAIDIGAYVMAWDGNSEPVVANIPAGVSVTYNTTTYTGTLAASASTIQKIYLVATGTTDNYDRYITVGDSTYSWVNIGTTEITLADYATKSEVSQLEAEVHQLAGKFYGVFADDSDLPEGDAVGYAFVGTENPYAIWNFDGEEWSDSGSVVNGITGEPGVGFSSIFTPDPYDGTVIIVLSNNDTITLDLNHNHDGYYSKVLGGAMPVGGFLPDVVYSLGTLTGTVTFALAAAVTGNVNHYFWMFDTDSTAPTITWPAGLTWAAGSAPTVAASKHYEISVLNGIAYYSEV